MFIIFLIFSSFSFISFRVFLYFKKVHFLLLYIHFHPVPYSSNTSGILFTHVEYYQIHDYIIFQTYVSISIFHIHMYIFCIELNPFLYRTKTFLHIFNFIKYIIFSQVHVLISLNTFKKIKNALELFLMTKTLFNYLTFFYHL